MNEPNNIRIEAFLNNTLLEKAKDICRERKISFTSYSEMIRKIIFDYNDKIQDIILSFEFLKSKNEEAGIKITHLNKVIEEQQGEIAKLNNEITRLENNLEVLRSKKAKK